MNTLWVLALTLGVVSAGPLGYQYKVPQTSYGLPSYQHEGGSSQFNSAYASSGAESIYKAYPTLSSGYSENIQSGSEFGSGLSSTLSSDLQSGYNHGYGSEYSSGLSSGLNSGLSSGISSGLSSDLSSGLSSGLDSSYYLNSGSGSSVYSGQPIYQYTGSNSQGGYYNQYDSSKYQASALDKYKNHYQISQQPAQVFKHFYVHSAPEEPEQEKPRTPIVLPPPQKHYKIIFVKTPSESRAPQVVPVPQVQNEEKTIVYVLVKKPEETQDVIVPKVEQKPPTKPEVYFIKYKNKEDSQAVINNIVKDYNSGQPVSLVNTGVGEGNAYESSALSGGSGLSGNFGGSAFSDTYDNSGLINSFDNSGLGNTYDKSGLSSSYGSSVLSNGYGNTGLSEQFDSSSLGSVYGSSGYQAPVLSEASASSFGSNAFGISASPATQTLSLASAESSASEGLVANGVSSPVTVSSTASTVSYDDANVSTSQGVPHETYGTPKFRVD